MGKYVNCALLAALIAVSGCTRSTNALNVNTQAPPQPLPSTPAGSLQAGSLDPISQDGTGTQIADTQSTDAPSVVGTEAEQAQTEVASLDPTPTTSSKPISHEQLAGAWNVGSDGAGCRVFLSFTQWSGGYRAGSRGCQSPELSAVSAWDVKGSKVVLVDTNGNQVASLGSAGAERYAGATVSGKPVSFSR